MSVLETPRIYFRGQVVWDPIVTNNADQFYDETTSEPVFPSVSNKVLAFRTEAIAAVNPTNGGLWNPHGTHRSSFYDAAISGADLGGGPIENDAFVKSPARFTGMLVDLEPYGTISSQLFFDSMTFGIDGGYRITAPRNSRLTSRYISFYRNPVGYPAFLTVLRERLSKLWKRQRFHGHRQWTDLRVESAHVCVQSRGGR